VTRGLFFLSVAVVLAPSLGLAGEIPDAVLVLEAAPHTPGSEPSGAPPRFVLLKDGVVFVGGTSLLETGRLEKREASDLRRRADDLRKLPGFSEAVSFPGDPGRRVRLQLLEGKRFDLTVGGDLASPPPALAPLAAFLAELMSFDHPSLRPYVPEGYALAAREATLVGGCRPWRFPVDPTRAVASGTRVSASSAEGWPTGALPASVCSGDRRYAVTLRPLLPGEEP
jgi:hypothetical protein